MPHSILFCGTPDFAVPSLDVLFEHEDFDIRLVITQPDRPAGRKQILTSPPVKTRAKELGIPVAQPQNISREIDALRAEFPLIADIDFLVVVAYGQILSEEVLALPKIAPVNVHGSLLPRWRGASPIEHAILAGDKETGVTIQVMAKELDAGDILSKEILPITEETTAISLRKKMSNLGADLLVKTIAKPLNPVPQPEEGITFCTKLSREDGKADPQTMSAQHIKRMVRALNPWPGVTLEVEGTPIKLLEVSLTESLHSVALPCAEHTTLYLESVRALSGKTMSGADWARGNRHETSKAAKENPSLNA